MVKNLPAMQEGWIRSLSWDNPLEKGMETYFSVQNPMEEKEEPGGLQSEEPGGLQSIGLQRVGHD